MENPLDLVASLLDDVTRTLALVGIEVSAFVAQLLMLIFLLALLYVLRKSWWPLRQATLQSLLPALALSATALAIVASWLGQLLAPPPGSLQGMINSPGPAAISVSLLDLRGQPMASSPPVVDPETGAFLGLYHFRIGYYPRAFALARPGCDSITVPVSLGQLRQRHVFQVNFQCQPGRPDSD